MSTFTVTAENYAQACERIADMCIWYDNMLQPPSIEYANWMMSDHAVDLVQGKETPEAIIAMTQRSYDRTCTKQLQYLSIVESVKGMRGDGFKAPEQKGVAA